MKEHKIRVILSNGEAFYIKVEAQNEVQAMAMTRQMLEHSKLDLFDPNKPRIVKLHDIHREKKKPYTTFNHCEIMRGDSMSGIPEEILQTNLSWEKLSNSENPKHMTEEDAELTLKEL